MKSPRHVNTIRTMQKVVPVGKFMMLCLTAILSGDATDVMRGQIVVVRSQAETEKVLALHTRALQAQQRARPDLSKNKRRRN